MTNANKGVLGSETYGRQPMNLQGHYHEFQNRTDLKWGKFTDADRQYRNTFLKDQVFSPRDGKLIIENNPDYKKARYNIFRRIWQAPMDFVESSLTNAGCHPIQAKAYRYTVSTLGKMMVGAWGITYIVMYNISDWTKLSTFKIQRNKPIVYPGDPDEHVNYEKDEFDPKSFSGQGFYKSIFNKS